MLPAMDPPSQQVAHCRPGPGAAMLGTLPTLYKLLKDTRKPIGATGKNQGLLIYPRPLGLFLQQPLLLPPPASPTRLLRPLPFALLWFNR